MSECPRHTSAGSFSTASVNAEVLLVRFRFLYSDLVTVSVTVTVREG